MAVKFVPCTSVEQADEMYWAGLLYFNCTTQWTPVDRKGCEELCRPMKIIPQAGTVDYFGGYMAED